MSGEDAAGAAAPMTDAEAAAAAFLAASGVGGAKQAPKKKDNKKKKKKAGGGAGEEKGEAAAPKQSAAGKAIAERIAKQREEEERIRKEEERLEEEEKRREAEEEAARKKEEEEKAEKKRKADEKKAKKKAEGTYKTKKQKEQEARAKAALDAMIAAGMEVPSAGAASPSSTKQRPVYGKKKRGSANNQSGDQRQAVESNEEAKTENAEQDKKLPAPPAEDSSSAQTPPPESPSVGAGAGEDNGEAAVDDWDAVADDWDAADVGDLLANVKVSGGFEEEEDLIEKERLEELERLREAGLRHQKLEEQRRLEEEMRRKQEEEHQREILAAEMRKSNCRKARLERESEALRSRSRDNLRCPIVCIMGHVDTGKTKLLDKIRQTNVQEGEAGGITQQIGATYFAHDTLKDKVAKLNKTENVEIKLPGMLVIDTPGHESFSNLRSRGSTLCDIAILVIDLMHGLEPQTIESLNLLRSKRTPFVVALNKVDRLYGWKSAENNPVRHSLDDQTADTLGQFDTRASQVRMELMEKGLNAELYWKNKDPATTVSLVPTSAITGEGIPDLLLWLVRLTQERLTEKIMFMPTFLQCTVLEVKVIEGLGTTVDVILVNGSLSENDQIIVCTMDGPVTTHVRALLTPPPSREMRVKSEYIHHKQISGAIGVKLCASGIEKAIAGTPIMVVGPDDDEEDIKEEVMKDFNSIKNMNLESRGVLVQASTLGALEALLQFLQHDCNPPIPVSGINIGPIYKRDVLRASIMLEKGKPEFATILAFDVKIDADARTYAQETGVRIFTADIIYHLFDQFTSYMDGLMAQRREEAQGVAVFPCICKIMKQNIFNKKDPIILGLDVVEGVLKVGTPLCIPAMEGLDIGVVTSIESNHREVQSLNKGMQGAVRIENPGGGSTLTYGRQFDHASGSLYSKISRASIDALRENFRSQVTPDLLKLLVQLKKVFNIP